MPFCAHCSRIKTFHAPLLTNNSLLGYLTFSFVTMVVRVLNYRIERHSKFLVDNIFVLETLVKAKLQRQAGSLVDLDQ